MGSALQFPPGFRFHPSDEELIVHYLRNKVTSHPLPASVIAEIDLYKYNPWELPKKALFGEEEWYFFSPRERKYPNGTRPNRAAASGYWKATGTDKPIQGSCGSNRVGVKKALVFYIGRPPKGVKTDWIMNEYRLIDTTLIRPSRFRGSMRLDDWVLCRVRQRGSKAKLRCQVKDSSSTGTERSLPDIMGCTASRDGAITDYLYKDCRLLATILAGHTLWPNETDSSVSFEKSNNFNSFAANQDDSNQASSQVTVPPPFKNGMDQFQDNFFTSNKPDPSTGFEELNEMAFTDRYIH